MAQAAYFLGDDVVRDPGFWTMVLQTGVEELERQFRDIEADTEKDAARNGDLVVFGSLTIIDQDDDRPFDPDDLPF